MQEKFSLFPTDGQSKVYFGLIQTALRHHSDKHVFTFSLSFAVGDMIWSIVEQEFEEQS